MPYLSAPLHFRDQLEHWAAYSSVTVIPVSADS